MRSLTVDTTMMLNTDHVVVDVSDVLHPDATSLRFLANLQHHVKHVQQSSVKLVGVNPLLLRALHVTGLFHMFEVELAIPGLPGNGPALREQRALSREGP